jgi:CRP-like cAMP-binding protein
VPGASPPPASLHSEAQPGRQSFVAGQAIYTHSTAGAAWRVVSGSVRLDRREPNGEQNFANLAIMGDVIGAETLLFGHYSFTATALTPCLLVPWPEGCRAPAGESLLHSMAKAERRAAEVIALRCGQAADRVRRLVMLLAQRPDVASNENSADLQVVLPPRQDMADITALTLETVSRMVSRLRHSGILNPVVRRGCESNSSFVVRDLGQAPF